MKGHMEDGKFHPHIQYKGVRKSRDQKAKTQGVRLARKARENLTKKDKQILRDWVKQNPNWTTIDDLPNEIFIPLVSSAGDDIDKRVEIQVEAIDFMKSVTPKSKKQIHERKARGELFSKLEEIGDPSADERYFIVKGVTSAPELDDVDPPKIVKSDIVVRTLNFFEATGDERFRDKPFVSELLLVPQNKTLHPEVLERIADSSGIDEKEVNIIDKVGYGASIRLGNEIDGDDAIKITNEVSRNAEATANLIGFSLDQPVNQIGETGWDMLRRFVLNEGGRFG